MQKTIFVVDDSLANLMMAHETLESRYRVITLSSAEKMFVALKKIAPDLILLDIAMPEMSGFDAMKQLKASKHHANIPVIFLTALSDSYNEALGIELGAVDFITKPFSVPVLLNRVKNHLQIDDIIRKRTEWLARLKNGIAFTFADVVERRDKYTGGHIERMAANLKILMDAMVAHRAYVEEIRRWDLEEVASAARLHDVGKIVIPDSILNKPGSLTEEEFETVKTHTIEGGKIIDRIISEADESEFLQSARLIAVYHHERWDGKGYPHELKGNVIPLHGRLMAVIDVYDALVSERPYKKALAHEAAVNVIRNDAGKHFDPLIAGVFCETCDQFKVV